MNDVDIGDFRSRNLKTNRNKTKGKIKHKKSNERYSTVIA